MSNHLPDKKGTLEFLKTETPFQALSKEQFKILVENCRWFSAPKGTEIIKQGERGEELFLIRSGEVAVLQSEGISSRTVATLTSPAFFGEAALLAEVKRNASVRAIKETELCAIPGKLLAGIIAHDPELSTSFFDLLSLRDRPRQAAGICLQPTPEAGKKILAILKNPERGTYYHLSPEGLFIWQRLDGHHNLRDLTLEYFSTFHAFSPLTIVATIAGLAQAGFVISRATQATTILPTQRLNLWQKFLELIKHGLTWRLVIRNVDPITTGLYEKGGKHLFSWPSQIAMAAVAVCGLSAFLLLTPQSKMILGNGAQTGRAIFYLLPAFLLSIVLHEAGHALTTKAFGRQVLSMGIGWHWFVPIFFVDTSDMWLEKKWPRIAVSFAGTYADLVLAGGISLIAFFVNDPQQASALWMFALASYAMVLGNLNPLMEFDGYYILMDLLDRPNLRQHCLSWIQSEIPQVLKNPLRMRGHRTEVLYTLGSIVYVIVVVILAVIFYRLFVWF